MKAWKLTVAIAALCLVAGSAGAQEIFDAVKSNDLARAKAIVEKDGSLVRVKDRSGNTPLHVAAIAGSVPMVEWLLSKSADIDAGNTESLTPLDEAIRNAKDDVARVFIEKGARIGQALHLAARRNRTAVVDLLIAKGADIEARNPNGYTPLSNITRTAGPFEALALLVQKGANINVRDSLGHTPLDNAVVYAGEDNRTVDLLIDRSAEINTTPESMREMLSAAALRGHVRLFEYYLARSGEALFADESDRRAFMRNAIMGGSLEIVRKLQSRGIPLDLTANRSGATPLHSLASNPAALGMIELLVRNGADVNARTNNGRSAYNIADASGNKDAVSLLRRLGASTEPQKFPPITGAYLGQAPPENDTAFFAPGIIYLDHGTISISPDGQEMYWPTGTAIMMTRLQDGRWIQPAFAPFSGPSHVPFHDDVPFVTPDNRRLFFTSKRPVGSETSQKENIWFVERTATGWSQPKPVGEAVNAMTLHWQVSVSTSGTLCFAGQNDKDTLGGGDIYCSRLVDGQYTKPVNMGPAINSKDYETQPFIAPDESFILFYRVFNQIPSPYASFRGSSGQWLPAVKFDLPRAGAGLMVSPDGKYLFFDNRWRSAKFLDDLRRQAEAAAKGQEYGHVQ